MVADRLLEKQTDPDVKRRHMLFITQAGLDALDAVRDIVSHEPEDAFWMLSQEEHAQTVALLRKVTAAYVERFQNFDRKDRRL